MPRYKKIYESNAIEYDLLVSREDYQGNILKALKEIKALSGLEVAEFGAGTGRLTRLLAPHVKRIQAFDLYPEMVKKGNESLQRLKIDNAHIAQAENKRLPIADQTVDLSIAGWTFGHCTSWFPENWKDEIDGAVQEMFRITKPNGAAIILETLGTGATVPKPPNELLAHYYGHIESEYGFVRSWVKTDYQFTTLEEARYLTSTFFGRQFDFKVSESGVVVLSECTGIWSKIF